MDWHLHYIIIVPIIAVIVVFQTRSFISTLKKLKVFRTVFAEDDNAYAYDTDSGTISIKSDKSKNSNKSDNPVLEKIVESINKYLSNNKAAISDFHLMKDIVDRNCDAKDEEISAQIPVPLYLGLMGTMAGILIGIGYLVYSGELNDLLGNGTGSGTEGVKTLLGGVALAMISSIAGIFLTTRGSNRAKKSKSKFEKNKNIFLSWIHASLLPTLSNNLPDTLGKMTNNLTAFNETFSSNTTQLKQTLSTVNETTHNQTALIEALNKLEIDKIATENINVYNKLKNCTAEIGQFAKYMQNVNNYLVNIQTLADKLDGYEKRTQIIEQAGRFYARNEIWLTEYTNSANTHIQDALDSANIQTQYALDRMTGLFRNLVESLDGQILNLTDAMQRQREIMLNGLNEMMQGQQEIMRDGLNEMMQGQREILQSQEPSAVVTELQNLTAVKDSILQLMQAASEQNGKIDRLVKSIENLVKMKTDVVPAVELSVPKWLTKTALLIVTAIFGYLITCIILFVYQQIF